MITRYHVMKFPVVWNPPTTNPMASEAISSSSEALSIRASRKGERSKSPRRLKRKEVRGYGINEKKNFYFQLEQYLILISDLNREVLPKSQPQHNVSMTN